MRNIFKEFDKKLIFLINDKMKTKFLDRFMVKFTNMGSAVFISMFIFSLIAFGNKETKRIGIETAATLAISQTITYSLKSLLSRDRPYKVLKNLNTFGIKLKDYSFPSGHSSASFSVATIIAINMPVLSIFVIALALLVGISRVYLGVHYPTDVVAGIAVGVGSALIVHMFVISHIFELIAAIRL